jgi:hypothetical protein
MTQQSYIYNGDFAYGHIFPTFAEGLDVVIYGLQLQMTVYSSGEKTIGPVPSQWELRIPILALYRASKRGRRHGIV